MIYTFLEDYYLRPLKIADLEGPYPTWFSDQNITQYSSHGKFFKNENYFISFYENLNREDQVVLGIFHKSDGHIGNLSLQDISWLNRTAEFAIIIGNQKHHRKGVSIHASRYLLDHGFQKLNLNKIYCGTSDNNIGMQRLALNLGMKEEGRRIDHLFLEGSYRSIVLYYILAKDWDQK
ncbi:GNAT family N-acetyltransferase [Leptospira sp. 96542]|nr:GNAT family N-acetyltransferase [Leptospira sp. 96542]